MEQNFGNELNFVRVGERTASVEFTDKTLRFSIGGFLSAWMRAEKQPCEVSEKDW